MSSGISLAEREAGAEPELKGWVGEVIKRTGLCRAVAQLVDCLSCMHKASGSFFSTTGIWCGGAQLYSQHLEGEIECKGHPQVHN